MIAPGERSSPSGQELLAEFVQFGRQRPFEEITRRYAGMVFNVCLRVTKDKHDAEDATQAVFLTLALKAKQGTEIKAIGPWLQQVAKRLSLDLRRGKKRRKTREERHESEQTFRRESLASEALPTADLDELKVILHEELHKLPAKYRIPLILHYFGGMNREEMAAELNCKPSTLGVRIFRGREMLAGKLSNRGVHLAAGAMALLLGMAVKDSVSHGMVAGTSHAAAMMAGGHTGAGLASAQVVALAHRAGGALAVGKLKVGMALFLLTGASLGAGGRALGVLPSPAALLQRVVEAGVRQLLRPLTSPVLSPMRAEAMPPAVSPPLAIAAGVPATTAAPLAAVIPTFDASGLSSPAVPVAVGPVGPVTIPTVTPAAPVAAVAVVTAAWPPAVSAVVAVTPTVSPAAPTAVARRGGSDAGVGGSGGRSGVPSFTADKTPAAAAASTPADNNLYVPAADATATVAAASEGTAAGGGGGGGTTAVAASATASATTPSSRAYTAIVASPAVDLAVSPASQVQIVQIPAGNGSLSESNGILRGWGQVTRTGTVDLDGRVVADGGGHDRTLSLADVTGVRTDEPDATGGNGWYAADHGRLTLPLRAAADDPSVLCWGTDTNDNRLQLVNSVRLSLDGSAADAAMAADPLTLLSLLSVDRDDAPALQQIDGATIGLWQVAPADGEVPDADLSIRYDDALIAALGGSESAVQLWTLDAADGGSWQQVPPASFALDTVDHVVSGSASDFDYFAVSVAPATGVDVGQILAHPSAEPAGAAAVPEPAGLALLGTAAAVLSSRRRRALLAIR